jgi:MoaA/NifB/PqqE/SkfB family radical SAM enzyme
VEGKRILVLLLCNYYVTYRCNAYCKFCHFGDHSKFNNSQFAKIEDYKSNVFQLSQLGVKFIDITGGEPLLHRDISEMAEFAKKLKIQTSITTNGLLYPKYAESLAGNIDLLHFSLDSPDEGEHNQIRGVNCYKSVFKSIEIAKSLGEFPDIIFTVTNQTYTKLPEMYEISSRHNLILIINPVFSYFKNPGLNDDALIYIENFIKNKKDIYLNDAYLKLRKEGGNKIEKPLCKAVSRVIVISPNNEVLLPCYHFANERIFIDKPIKDIRKSERIKYFKSMEGRFDFCQGCTVNCYFEPSFFYPTNIHGIIALKSKLTYGYNKLVKQKIQKKLKMKEKNK